MAACAACAALLFYAALDDTSRLLSPRLTSRLCRARRVTSPRFSCHLFADLAMSSQAIATSTRGLPDFPSPPLDLHNFPDSTWAGHPNLHGDASKPDDEQDHARTSHSPASTRQSWSDMDPHRRKVAVGNLLAALAPIHGTQTAIADASREPASPSNKSEDTLKSVDVHHTPEPSYAMGPLPDDANGSPHTTLPSLPPLGNDDFMDGNALQPPSAKPPMDPTEQTQTALPGGEYQPTTANGSQPPVVSQDPLPERREIEAFAKIEFEDGNYYITTYACELGRDAFAYRSALMRAEEARQADQGAAQSSSGRRSGLSEGVPRPADSQVQGSVVSEAGGFGGVDDGPLVHDGEQGDVNVHHSHTSEISAGSVVKPQEVLINPPLIPFDYHKMAERQAQLHYETDLEPDNEQPAPVTADHIPDANNCPLIPIHAMRNFQKSEVENHRSISRRHVKIQWDFDAECFKMRVLGRNGAFLEDQYLERGEKCRLRDGARIQISNVWMTFRLPNQKAEFLSEDSEHDDADQSPLEQRSTSPTSNEQDRSLSPSRSGKTRTRITLTSNHKTSPTAPDSGLGPDGQPFPPRKRGPGRPPKDGIMSTRERREREKALKLAEARAANGGRTPPPTMRGKLPKPIIKEEVVPVETKPEKRKYKKRKRSGEDGDVLQSIEGGEMDVPSEPEKAPVKKARQSKSPSPEYPPAENLTEEQLARPSEPYARLIYDILIDIHPKALPLKQIYRALKLKFPFFVHRVDSEGWQSSVRHNLNQEWNKLFEKGEKEGKGFAWKAIPGAQQPQAERRRAAQQAAAAKPKPITTPRPNPPQGPPPPLNWQNSTPYPHPNGMPPRGPPPPFFVQGPNGPMPQPGGIPPPGMLNPAGNAPPQMGPGQNHPPFYPPPQGARPPFPPQQAPPHPGPGQPIPPNQGLPRPSSSSTPGPPPPTISSSSASRNMPCTTDGLLAIRRFETAMYDQVGDPARIEGWQRVFASVKRRLLHGAPQSSLPDGETKEELTIMEHVRRFIDRFKNPNFVGFSIEQPGNTSSPVPVPVPVSVPVQMPVPVTAPAPAPAPANMPTSNEQPASQASGTEPAKPAEK